MTRAQWFFWVVALPASAACAQTPDRRGASETTPGVDLSSGMHASLATDSDAQRADSLVRAGRPWRATLLLAGVLRTAGSASPQVRLAGARAAAAWGGWSEVERILRDAPWLDQQLEGEGRELLVRAALERGQPAVDEARLAVAAARTDAQRVARRVLLARALDRANVRDSAAAAYAGAAARLPEAADWLRLRAAGVATDESARASLLAAVTSPVARARVPWTDAQARERSGDFVGAARLYRSVGAEPAAFRVETFIARDEPSRSALAQRIVTYLGGARTPADVRLALQTLDSARTTLTPDQELVVARAAAASAVPARAVSGFQRARTGRALSGSDQLLYASALARAGRGSEAVRAYDQLVASDPALAPYASFQRARTMLQSGGGTGVRASLRDIASRYAAVDSVAAPALLLLADLQIDDGDVAGAASSLGTITRRHPRASQAPLAGFRAGLIAWTSNPDRSAAVFDSVVAAYPNHDEARAARYWSGRSLLRAGRRAEAEQRFTQLARESSLSYYGVVASRRLGRDAWAPPAGPDTVAHTAAIDSVVARVRTLQLLGMDVEARFEIDALVARGEQSAAETDVIAQALRQLGEHPRALRLAARAIDRGGPASRALLRLAYPVVHADALADHARRAGVDPALVAGIIRQESTWNPQAVSPVGARGLMQLMPSVGASLAAGRRYPVWLPSLLFEPEVSLELGTLHLAPSLRRGDVTRALAAYNAGGSRVTRWSRRPGVSDPEMFAEWIPYVETRDYVRIVQRNAAVYRALYDWR